MSDFPSPSIPAGLLEIDVRRDTDVTVVSLCGELDMASIEVVQDAMAELDHDPPARLVLDLSRLSFIDSSGLRLVVFLHARCEEEGSPALEIRPGPPAVQRVFELTGVIGRLPFAPPPAA